MRSAIEDRTAQARIRDAAIALFPQAGMGGSTLRAIASQADVSPGLVIHHFGSKEGLHRACDDYVVEKMLDVKRQTMETGANSQPDALAAAYQLAEPLLRYLAWTLGSGNETAARIFDELVEVAAVRLLEGLENGLTGTIHGDVKRQAAVLVAIQLGGLVLHDHLSRTFGEEMLSAEGLLEAAPYTLQVFSGDLFDRDTIAETQRALSLLNKNTEETQ